MHIVHVLNTQLSIYIWTNIFQLGDPLDAEDQTPNLGRQEKRIHPVFTEFRPHKIHYMDLLRIFYESFVARPCKYEQQWNALWRLFYTYTKKIEPVYTSASRLYWIHSKSNKFGVTSFDHSQGIGPFRPSEEHPSFHPIEVPEPLRESDIALCQCACCDALSSAWGVGVVGQRIWRQLIIASAQRCSKFVFHSEFRAQLLRNRSRGSPCSGVAQLNTIKTSDEWLWQCQPAQ